MIKSFDIKKTRAKGYANMFLNWQDEALSKVLKLSSFTERASTKNRNKFNKLSKDLIKFGIKDCTFNCLIGGPKRHPFILFTEYNEGTITHNNYDERVILLSSRFFIFNNESYVSTPWPITINIHSIERLFERSGLIDLNSSEENLFDNRKVLNEMKYISLWANMWSAHASKIFKKCSIELEDIKTIPIPGDSGLFIAKYTNNQNAEGFHINVRTYYGFKELEEKGLIDFHKKLKQISLNLNNFLGCWPEALYISPGATAIGWAIFYFRFEKLFEEIILFLNEDKTAQSIIKNNFKRHLLNKTKCVEAGIPEKLSILLNNIGYLKFLPTSMALENKNLSKLLTKVKL